MQGYRDPVIAKIIAVLNASGPVKLKNRYFQGDPVVVAKSQLPAVFISKDKTNIGNDTVSEDFSRMPMVLNVVYDLTRDFGQAFDNIDSATAVYEMLEARNPDYSLRSDSIAAVLRHNQQLDAHLYIDFDKDLELDYGVSIGKRGDGIFTVEGVCKFEVYGYQLQP